LAAPSRRRRSLRQRAAGDEQSQKRECAPRPSNPGVVFNQAALSPNFTHSFKESVRSNVFSLLVQPELEIIMESRFILPVTIATALHAFVLLGVKWPHFPSVVSTPTVQKTDVQPVYVDLETPDKPETPQDDSSMAQKGSPEPLVPQLDEAPPRPSIFEQPAEARRPQPVDVVSAITSDRVGVLEGVDGGRIGDVVVFRPDALDNSPRTRSQVAPTYPAAERSGGITGDVLVEFIVDESGRVQHAHILQSTHSAFEAPTLRAIDKWRFEPGKKNNRAVRFRMVVPVHFSLEQ